MEILSAAVRSRKRQAGEFELAEVRLTTERPRAWGRAGYSICLALSLWAGTNSPAAAQPYPHSGNELELLTHLEPFEKWINRANIDLPFETYHSQGIVKIGDLFFLTAMNRSAAGYIIEFAVEPPQSDPGLVPNDLVLSRARFVKEVQLMDPAFRQRIHPGGIDYDPQTRRIWCPLAEKAASTSSSILTIDPRDLSYRIVGSVGDHLGTTIVDTGSRRIRMIDYHTGMFSFPLMPDGSFPASVDTARRFLLPGEWIEYQDCKYLQGRYAVCAGHRPHRVDLVCFDADVDGDTATPYRIETRYPLGATNLGWEAMAFEVVSDAFDRKFVRFYFKPDDGRNTKLRIYDAYPPDASFTLSGRVDREGSAPAEPARWIVELRSADREKVLYRVATSTVEGRAHVEYTLPKVPPGKYSVEVRTANGVGLGFRPVPIEIQDADQRIDFQLSAPPRNRLKDLRKNKYAAAAWRTHACVPAQRRVRPPASPWRAPRVAAGM